MNICNENQLITKCVVATWENQANSLAAFFPSLVSFGLLDLPVGLSKAPCRPVFNHDKTYLSTFQSRRNGPLILIISKSLKVFINCKTVSWVQADRTSRFDRDSPGLERYVPVSRKGTFGTHLCPGLQKAVPVRTEGITCDN